MKNYDKVPKLSEWPDWAVCFAVDRNGGGYWHNSEPTHDESEWLGDGMYVLSGLNFDQTDWENSLLTRKELEDDDWVCLVPYMFPDLRKKWEIELCNIHGEFVQSLSTMKDLVERYLSGKALYSLRYRYREIKQETVEDYAHDKPDGFLDGVKWRDRNPGVKWGKG